MMTLIAPAFMEFIGCFVFIYTICMAVASESPLTPLAIGSCLMVIIYVGGHVSGGHFNPAVSLGVFICDPAGFPVLNMVLYWVCQFLGGMLGGVVAYGVFSDDDSAWNAAIKPGKNYSDGDAFVSELIYTFLLVFTVLNVATSINPAYKNNSFFALAIGFSVFVGATAGGPVSGGAFNPAVAFGVTVADSMADGNFKKFWIPLIADFLGGALAGVCYRFIINPFLASKFKSA